MPLTRNVNKVIPRSGFRNKLSIRCRLSFLGSERAGLTSGGIDSKVARFWLTLCSSIPPKKGAIPRRTAANAAVR